MQHPEDSPVRIAVAGLGKMGIMHTAMIRSVPGAEVAALVDFEENLGKQVASMMGRPAPWFSTIGECLEKARPDGVIVATPQFAHREVTEACLRAGVAVLCEKPLAHTLADARAMVALANQHPTTPAGTGFMLAHNPLFAEAARIVREGVLGSVRSARASCYLSQVFSRNQGWTFTREKAGGGVVINSGSHLLYVLREILGPVHGVLARGVPMHNDVEDTFAAMVDFENGAWATVDISWSVPGYEFQTHDLRIEGTNGTVEVGNDTLRVWLIVESGGYAKGWTQKKRATTDPRAPLSLSPDYCGDEFWLEDADFVAAIREGRQPKVGFDAGLEIQFFLDAVYRSMERGAYVRVERTVTG